MRAFVVFLILAVTLGAVAVPAGLDGGSTPTDVVVARYNLQRTGVATDVGTIVDPVVRWTFQTNGTIATSPLAADLDGDGAPEIFFGEFKPGGAADGSRLGYVLRADGSVRYAVPMRYNSVAAAAADLDGDGRMEVVFSEGSHFDEAGGLGYRVFNGEDGSPLWTFATPFIAGEGFFASPAIADLDGDGRLDLVAGSMDHSVYALRGADGAVLWRSPVLEHYIRHSPPLGDLDGDGRPDVVAHTEAGIVHVYDAASGALRWERRTGTIVAATPAMGDLDGDGRLDLVVSHVTSGGVVALRGNGSTLWQNAAHDFSYRGPALLDVDGDGLLDVVEGDANDPSVTAYRGIDGAILWDRPLAAAWASGPIVAADIDGDGEMEIVAGSDSGLLSLRAATGEVEWEFPMPAVRGEPLVRDIDGDGAAEVLVGAGDGRLYVIGSPPAPSPADLKHEAIQRIKALKEQALARGDKKFVHELDHAEEHVWKSLGYKHPFKPESIAVAPGADVTVLKNDKDKVELLLGLSWDARLDAYTTVRLTWSNGVVTVIDLPDKWPKKDFHWHEKVRVDAWEQDVHVDVKKDKKAGVEVKVHAHDASLGFSVSLDADLVADLAFTYEVRPWWVDDAHLDPKHGKKVFDEEKKAVKHLTKREKDDGATIIRCKLDKKDWTADERTALDAECDAIANLLVKADEVLARVAIADAMETPVKDPKYEKKVQHEIDKALKELGKAYAEWDKLHYDHAIQRFKKAWEHAQHAIQHAMKA